MTKAVPAPHHTLGVASRVVAATAGSYALAAVASLWLEHLLPYGPRPAALTANMVFFLVYGGAVVWVFAAASAWRAWAWIAGPALVLGGTYLAATASASAGGTP